MPSMVDELSHRGETTLGANGCHLGRFGVWGNDIPSFEKCWWTKTLMAEATRLFND
jgi:hypothetical protein